MTIKIRALFILFMFQGYAFGQTVSDSIIDGVYIQEMNLINGKHELRIPKPVTVKLVNSTGYDIDTLIFYSIYFPKLQKDSSTVFFAIPNYEKSDFVRGSVQGLKIDNGLWGWDCKPGPFDYENKTLIIEIILADSKVLKDHYRLETSIKEIIE
ncbi:hypothetical protein [Fluviicola taffensis]|uniref:Uncharacterized protein n=1 Tax=Fluviicola taffensis (strain DSM 16823 / NCIMB 13979 / RW262) TaxID=755732 RepID=F2IHX1_FLUTR|nr:hypothetical protein [Fluviicola taffensis]AEA45930.1 hypothetical protein Fluta_3966 [Fluviicola taffensis DSM 16823]